MITARKRSSFVRIGLLVLLSMLTLQPGMAHASERGGIRGIIQQRDRKGVAEHRIMLIRFGPDQAVERTPGQTDAEGRFAFDNLETGEQFQYFVGIRYDGQLYRSDSVTLDSGEQRTGVHVEVGQTAAKAPEEPATQSALQITKHLMMVTLQDDHLAVREVVSLRNTGSEPYTGSAVHSGQMSFSLYLPLPEGYYDLGQVQGLDANHLNRDSSGLYYGAPIPTGEHRVVYTYALPFRHDQTVLFAAHSMPTAVFEVFVEDTHLVAASDLTFVGRVAAEPHTFLHFRTTDLSSFARSWLQLTRHTPTPSWLRIGAYSLILGIALLGLVIPGYAARRERGAANQPQSTADLSLPKQQATHQGLLQTIAQLDNQWQAGKIEEDTYRQQRQAYKNQLLELIKHLELKQQKKEGDA